MNVEQFYYQLGDAPGKPTVDLSSKDAKSAALLDEVVEGFVTAYRHGTIAYLLRKKDDENGPVMRMPEGMVFADRLMTGGATNTACKYAGKGYLYVNASEGNAILEEVESYISGRLQDVFNTARSFSMQDPSVIEEVYSEMYSFHELLVARMPASDSDLNLADLRNYIDPENWEEDLARMFREKVTNQIPGVISRQYNTAVMLSSHLKAYKEIVETTWQALYSVLETGIEAFFQLAEVSSPQANLNFLQLLEIVGPALKKSFGNLDAPIATVSATVKVVDSQESSTSVGGSTAAALRESVHEQLSNLIRGADTMFEELGNELTELSNSLEDLYLYELTLPEIDSIF
jgi:hypothetical protein